MDIIPHVQGFDWDSGNRDKNWKRHAVAWWECEELFFNIPLYVLPDDQHSRSEARNFAFGQTHNGRLLLVVFTVRKSKIRVISARDMNKRERKFYYEKAQEDSKI